MPAVQLHLFVFFHPIFKELIFIKLQQPTVLCMVTTIIIGRKHVGLKYCCHFLIQFIHCDAIVEKDVLVTRGVARYL